MIIETGFQQCSDEWKAARVGNPGATGIKNIITSTGQPSKSREKYLYQMAEEVITGVKPETFQNHAMRRGIELESDARDIFCFKTGYDVQECSMIYPCESKRWHVSPDGIIPSRNEGLEIKCPSLIVHDGYMNGGVCPTEYRLQVQGSLAVSGYKAWHFMSYFPEVRPFIIRVERDEKLISIIIAEMDSFINDLDELVNRLKS